MNLRIIYELTQGEMDKGNYVTLSRSFEEDFVLEEITTFSGLTFERRITKDAYNAEAKQKGHKDFREGQQDRWKTSNEDNIPKQHKRAEEH